MQAKNACPAMATIDELIRGGFADETRGVQIRTRGHHALHHNVIGGGDLPSNKEIVCDNMKFYISRRKLELARFELSARSASPDARAQKYHAMFGEIAGATRWDVYRAMIDREIGKATVYQHLCNLLDIIGSIEGMIMQKSAELASAGGAISITLPDLVLPPNVDVHALYNPTILARVVELLRGYVMRLNISSIAHAPPAHIEKIGIPPVDPGADFWDVRLPAAPATPTLDDMKSTLSAEMEVAAIACSTEQYHITAVEKMNEIFTAIDAIRWL